MFLSIRPSRLGIGVLTGLGIGLAIGMLILFGRILAKRPSACSGHRPHRRIRHRHGLLR